MYVIFLKFGPNRAQVAQWSTAHKQWIQAGIDDGIFLAAGSLEDAQGGAIIATGVDKRALVARVTQDPFVAHGVVTAEVHAIAPSVMSSGFAELLSSNKP
ncbi:YciI family protein [Chitinolyticbacter meiyuanensis]|uniref:YciI family protein n=1 Tax=Chitinolyticbacter meiyuanensis TaxID=682798 RepID=UPI0011E5DD99|nr:YciI family protein [Chitinolyticbacter meiyuanensis]